MSEKMVCSYKKLKAIKIYILSLQVQFFFFVSSFIVHLAKYLKEELLGGNNHLLAFDTTRAA
jgi:hypothetical protein